MGFQIGVAVRVRPRRHGRSERSVVLPLHQRLKTLKKGEKLSFAAAALPAEQIAQIAKEQGDVPPELFQALLEAAQLEASAAQAHAQAQASAARPGGGAGGAEEGSQQDAADVTDDDQAAAAGTDAADEAGGAAGGGKGGAATVDGGAKPGDKEDKENAEGAAPPRADSGARLLLVQPSRVTMFVPGVGVRPFLFGTVLDEQTEQTHAYHAVAQESVCSALNGLNACVLPASRLSPLSLTPTLPPTLTPTPTPTPTLPRCVLAYGQTGSGKTHTVFGPDGAIAEAQQQQRATRRRHHHTTGLDGGLAGSGLGEVSSLPRSAGLVLRACEEVLACAAAPGVACGRLGVSAQYVQIYNDEVPCIPRRPRRHASRLQPQVPRLQPYVSR